MNKSLQYWIVIFPNNPALRRGRGWIVNGPYMTPTDATEGVKSVDVTETETVVAVYCYSMAEAETMAWTRFCEMNEKEEDMSQKQSPDTELKMKIILLEAALQAMLTTYQDQCRSYTNQGIRYVDEYALWLTTSRDLVNELQAQLSALKNPVDAKPAPVVEQKPQ